MNKQNCPTARAALRLPIESKPTRFNSAFTRSESRALMRYRQSMLDWKSGSRVVTRAR